jgi:hypothetical protein
MARFVHVKGQKTHKLDNFDKLLALRFVFWEYIEKTREKPYCSIP